MLSTLTTRVLGALSLPLIAFSAPLQAQTLNVEFDGSLSLCSDPNLNGPLGFSFGAVGETSGADTIITVDLGSPFGSFSVPIPTSEIEAFTSSLAASGGTQTVPIGPLSLDDDSGCYLDGTLTLSIGGGPPGTLSVEAPGNLATSLTTLATGTRTDLFTIGNRIRSVFSGRTSGLLTSGNGMTISGMSAGNGDALRIGAWAGYSYTDTRNDFVTTAFDSDRHSVLFGVDAMHGDNLLMGVALGLDRTDVRTRFNAGEQGVTGMTIVPYIGVLFSDWLTMDAAFGYGDAQTDQFRTTAAGARINSDVESSRVFGSVNVTATHAIDSLLLSARTGALYATQKDDSFIESNGTVIPESRTNLGRFLLGGELAYAAGHWEPFVGGTYQYDFTRTETVFAPGVAQPRNDDADLLFAVGLRYYGDGGLSGAIEYNKLIGRRNLDEDTISANVRWTF